MKFRNRIGNTWLKNSHRDTSMPLQFFFKQFSPFLFPPPPSLFTDSYCNSIQVPLQVALQPHFPVPCTALCLHILTANGTHVRTAKPQNDRRIRVTSLSADCLQQLQAPGARRDPWGGSQGQAAHHRSRHLPDEVTPQQEKGDSPIVPSPAFS